MALRQIYAKGPLGGINEALDSRLIADNEFQSISDMVLRDGRLAPRAGYEELHPDSFGLAFQKIYESTGTASIHAIAIDTTNGAIYWTDILNGKIRKLVISTGVVSDIQTGLTTPRGICLDVANNRIYFTDESSSGAVRRCALSGGSITDIYTSVGSPGHITVNLASGALYWCIALGRISSDVSGSHAEFISSANAGNLSISTQLFLDTTNSYLYWESTSGGSTKAVKRASSATANTSVTTLISEVTLEPGMTVDVTNSRIYAATDSSEISRYTTAGASKTAVFSSQADQTFVKSFVLYSSINRLYFVSQDVAGSKAFIYSVNANSSESYPVSIEWFRRSKLGVTQSTTFASDIVWIQTVNTSNSNTEMAIFFPQLSIQKSIYMGYNVGSSAAGDPTIWAMSSRTANPSYFAPYSTSSAMCKFAFTGRGINTAKGGWLVAQSPVETTSNTNIGSRVLNYVLSDTIYTVEWTAGTSGTWQFVFDSVRSTGGLIADGSSTAAEIAADLLTIPAIDGVHVTKSSATWTIRIHGAWSGQNTPALSTNRTGGSDIELTMTQVQTGGLSSATSGYVGQMVYCRPTGLPRPTLGLTGTGNWEGDQASATAADSGYFNYCVTYYSSRWDLESPPSDIIGDQGAAYIVLSTGSSLVAQLQLNGVPSTLYFGDYPFKHIDYVRVYRRKWGTSSSTDGVGAYDDWYFIKQVHIGQQSGTITIQDDGDPALKSGTRLPVVNEYPPANAGTVEIHNDRACYLGFTPGDYNLWISELPKQGGVANGELGHEYVSNEANQQIARFFPADYNFTAIKSYAGKLMLGTHEHMLAIDLSYLTTQGIVYVDPLEGTSGVASQWAMAESAALPDVAGFLTWVSPYGHIYAFNGATTLRISKQLRALSDDMVKKFWNYPSYFESGLKTLHYATMAIDPIDNRIVLSTWDKSGNAYNLVYDLFAAGWTKWTIGGYGWNRGREQSGTDKGKDFLVFGTAGGKLWKMVDGSADAVTADDTDGSSFSFSALTKTFSPTMGFYKTHWHNYGAMFTPRDFGGSAASITITPVGTSGNLETGTDTSTDKVLISGNIDAKQHTVSIQFAGTQTDNQTHAELVGVAIDYDPAYTPTLTDTDYTP